MIKTKDFSYDLIYDQIQDFCIEHSITKTLISTDTRRD